MKINVRVLGWTDKCCGCYADIKPTERVCMISEVAGVTGSIHLCDKCMSEISNARDIDSETRSDAPD